MRHYYRGKGSLYGSFAATSLKVIVLLAFAASLCLITARSHGAAGTRRTFEADVADILKRNPKVEGSTEAQDDNICATKACHDWAKFLKSALAKNYTQIDPCTDFATWACGGWEEAHQLGPAESQISTLSDMQDENDEILHQLLEKPYQDKDYQDIGPYTGMNATKDKENFQKMKDVYDACMDQDAIRRVGPKPLVDLVSRLPDLSTFDTKDGLTDAIIWVLKYAGVAGLLTVWADVDAKHPERAAVSIGTGDYMLDSHEYYDDEDTVRSYTTAISGMFAQFLGGHAEDYHGIAKNVIDLEAAIARADPPPDKKWSVTYSYNPIPLAEADRLVPNITVSKVISALAPEGYKTDTVVNAAPDFFPKLADIVSKTSAEVIHAYLQWQLIQRLAYRVHEDYRKPLLRFNNWLNGYEENATGERWQACLGEVDLNLPWIVSSFFIRYRFNDKAKQLGEEMAQELKDVLTSRFDAKYDWMGHEAREKAKEKVANMITMIGYPTRDPGILDPTVLSLYYSTAIVRSDSYWDNGIVWNDFYTALYWSRLSKPKSRYEWDDDSSVKTVTAYMTPSENNLVIPAGTMQFPWFDAGLPDHINYGGLAGGNIGHEMTHHFDTEGREFDKNGAYNNWWDEETRANFDKKAQCIIDQFSNYTVPGLDGDVIHVNGQQTLTENIADTGGLSLGFEAWQKRARSSKGNNKLLPGMEEFTPEQLYFIAYASNYCYKVRPELQVDWARTDVHAPTDLRINGPMANSRGFREAFNCPVKEPTCELW